MQKLQRNYRMECEIGTRIDESGITSYNALGSVTISYPLTLRLDIKEKPYGGSSTGNFVFYNLAPSTRALLYKDKIDLNKYITIKLYAGYQDNTPLIFYGDVMQCYSYKKGGSTEYITEIQATDMMYLFQYGFANYTFGAGTSPENLLKTLLTDVPNLTLGYISPTLKTSKTPQTFWGDTFSLLKNEFLGYQVYVKNNELNILANDEVVPGQIPLINSSTGLLGNPRRAGLFLEFESIFEPGLLISQALQIQSYESYLDGVYKLVGLQHTGVISGRESGTLITRGTLSLGDKPRKELKKITQGCQPPQKMGKWQKPTASGTITSPFGKRNAPNTPNGKGSSNHQGIDIGVPLRTPVKAPQNGTVQFRGSKGGYGYMIILNHGVIDGVTVTSQYGHLDEFIVNSGNTVSAGQQIAYSGGVGSYYKAGSSTGPHLHFEIRENGQAVNPAKYIGSY